MTDLNLKKRKKKKMERTKKEFYGKTSMGPFIREGGKILEHEMKKSPTLQGGGGQFQFLDLRQKTETL
ncbi:hypothetical protein, partial [Treponema sp. R6D11]